MKSSFVVSFILLFLSFFFYLAHQRYRKHQQIVHSKACVGHVSNAWSAPWSALVITESHIVLIILPLGFFVSSLIICVTFRYFTSDLFVFALKPNYCANRKLTQRCEPVVSRRGNTQGSTQPYPVNAKLTNTIRQVVDSELSSDVAILLQSLTLWLRGWNGTKGRPANVQPPVTPSSLFVFRSNAMTVAQKNKKNTFCSTGKKNCSIRLQGNTAHWCWFRQGFFSI